MYRTLTKMSKRTIDKIYAKIRLFAESTADRHKRSLSNRTETSGGAEGKRGRGGTPLSGRAANFNCSCDGGKPCECGWLVVAAG